MAQAEQEKTYDVDATKYFQAVSQYEKYPEFVDGMKKVSVERNADGTVVGHYDLSMMSKDMSYVLNIKEDAKAGTVNWTLKQSDFFKINNGAWKIESIGPGQCKVSYSLDVEFNFSVPGFILKSLVKGTLPSMMKSFYERAQEL
jgi:ribosome-associated toxin RatA of RatAB toxin-antitoxin module